MIALQFVDLLAFAEFTEANRAQIVRIGIKPSCCRTAHKRHHRQLLDLLLGQPTTHLPKSLLQLQELLQTVRNSSIAKLYLVCHAIRVDLLPLKLLMGLMSAELLSIDLTAFLQLHECHHVRVFNLMQVLNLTFPCRHLRREVILFLPWFLYRNEARSKTSCYCALLGYPLDHLPLLAHVHAVSA